MNINKSPSNPSGHMQILFPLNLKQAASFLHGLLSPKHCEIDILVVDVVVVVDGGIISSLGIVPK